MKYEEIYHELKNKILELQKFENTKEITNQIKSYFFEKFKDKYVAGFNGNKGFLFDISILDENPLNASKSNSKSLNLILAVESELGGESASCPKNVERNVIEDFLKILYSNAMYKIMIGAYSESNDDVLKDRLNKMIDIAHKTANTADILVILIKGSHKKGLSHQVKIIYPFEISGFILKVPDYVINELDE